MDQQEQQVKLGLPVQLELPARQALQVQRVRLAAQAALSFETPTALLLGH
jgi:hypothetical protein